MPARRKQFLETGGEVTARVNFIKFMLLISLNIVGSSVPSRDRGRERVCEAGIKAKEGNSIGACN